MSDKGTIKRIDGWKESQEPFRVFEDALRVVNNLLGDGGSVRYGAETRGTARPEPRLGVWANEQQGEADVATTKMVYWQEDEWWLGYLEEFPDYWTQGETLDELKQHLRDLYADLTSGELPGVRRLADLTLA